MSETTGCRACRHYSASRAEMAGVGRSLHPWAHKCGFWGLDRLVIIRFAAKGVTQPVEVPPWCPLAVGETRP